MSYLVRPSFLLRRPPAVLCSMRICSFQWRHNGCDGVSNRQPNDCLFKRSFRGRPKKTSKLRDTGLCPGNSPVTGEFPAQMVSKAENVFILWRHHVAFQPRLTPSSTHPCVYVSLSQSISDSYPFRCFVNSVPACGTVISDSPINCVAYMHDIGQWHRKPAWPVLCRVIGRCSASVAPFILQTLIDNEDPWWIFTENWKILGCQLCRHWRLPSRCQLCRNWWRASLS